MCSICNNSYPNCPVCSPDIEPATCPHCDGEGVIYFDDNGNELSFDIWVKLPAYRKMSEVCCDCGGYGEI